MKQLDVNKINKLILLIAKDYKKALEELKDEKFDIIFLDPPYNTNFGEDGTKTIIENEMLSEDGIIIFETDKNEQEYIENISKFAKVVALRKYGRVKLVFLRRKE